MSGAEPDRDDFGLDAAPEEEPLRWPLSWCALEPPIRRLWFEQLWLDVCALRTRYRLMVRSGWWDDEIQVEALAALAGWVARYDSGEWDDPPGKLALLYDLQRVGDLLRPGSQPFVPERDRGDFERYVTELGRDPPSDPP